MDARSRHAAAADPSAGRLARRFSSFRLSSSSLLLPRRQPFMWLLAALLTGIVLERWLAPALWLWVMPLAVALPLALRFVAKRRALGATLCLLAIILLLGGMLSRAERGAVSPDRLARLFEAGRITADDPVALTCVVAAPPEPAPEACFMDVAAESLESRGEVMRAEGRARLFVPLGDAEAENAFRRLAPDQGSRLRLLVRLERARRYLNPGSVDFNSFLESEGFDLRGTVKSPLLIEALGRAPVSRWSMALQRVRQRIIAALDGRFDARPAGTLKAMLVNNRHFLHEEDAEKLRAGGTFHVISISGMHVGLIALALLGGGVAVRRRRVGRLLLALSILWAYAVMVGLEPPVVRATLMISVALVGPLLFRRAASPNAVALAAFLMLALKPALVADPSFQLSFAAVGGIVLLALPVAERLRAIGEWRPSASTPHPPACAAPVRRLAEWLYWDERAWRRAMRRAPIRFRMDKSPLARRLSRWRLQAPLRALALLSITSAAIQLTTLPLSACYFNRISPVGLLLNLFAGALTAALMAAGVAGLLAGAVSASLASLCNEFAGLAHTLLVNAVLPFLDWPGATFRVAHYEDGRAIVYGLYFIPVLLLAVRFDGWRPVQKRMKFREGDADGGAAAVAPPRRARSVVPCFLFMALSILLVARPLADAPSGRLEVHFLDVGQGDAALIVFPRGSTMLVDGGGEMRFDQRPAVAADGDAAPGHEEARWGRRGADIGEVVVSRFLWSRGLTRLDYVLATHADADHIGGLARVVENFEIGQALVGRVSSDSEEYQRFAAAVARRGVPLGRLARGERFTVEGVTVEVLWPPRQDDGAASKNNHSVVLRLVYGAAAILLAADIEREAEAALAGAGPAVRAGVLKVPHHGSKTSSTEGFLEAVRPTWAVVSVGERSRFGHPAPEVVERYRARGVRLLQTGRQGMVTVTSDGATIQVSTYRGVPD